MRRQRLRAAQAQSVCAFCASRLARDAPRLPSYGAGPIQIRENSRVAQLSNPDATNNSESPSSDSLRNPASSHASQASPAPSGTTQPPQAAAKDESGDLDFMDAVGVGRGSAVASQQAGSEQPQSLANSTPQAAASASSRISAGRNQGGITSGNAAQEGQGQGQLPGSSAAKEFRRPPPYISKFNKLREGRRMVAYNMAAEPPKVSRFWDPESPSSWSHLKTRGKKQDQWTGNKSGESQEQAAEPMRVLNPLKTGTTDPKSSAHASQDFADILARLGSKTPQQKSSGPSKPAPAPPANTSDPSDMSFAEYDLKTSGDQHASQRDAAQSAQSAPAEKIEDFGFAKAPWPTKSAPVLERTPPESDKTSTAPADYQDPSDGFDFATASPEPRSSSTTQQAPAVHEAEAKTPVVEDTSEGFDIAAASPEPRSATTTQPPPAAPEAETKSPVVEDLSERYDLATASLESRSTTGTQQPPTVPKVETKSLVDEHHSEEFDSAAPSPEPQPSTATQQAPAVPEAESKSPALVDSSEEFDFAAASPKPRSTLATHQAPATALPEAEAKSPVLEEYKDPADEFDFTATGSTSKPLLAPQEAPTPVAPPKILDDSDDFDFTAPPQTSRPGLAKQPEIRAEAKPASQSGGATLMTADDFFEDDGSPSPEKTSSRPKVSSGEETWAETAARRAREQPQTYEEPVYKPAPAPSPAPKRVQWSVPVEEPQRKSRSSRFAEEEEEVDDRSRKRKGNKSSKFSMTESDLEGGMKAEAKAERKKAKRRQEQEAKRSEVEKPTLLYLPEYISVSNFANLLKVRSDSLLKKMAEFGYEDVRPDDILNAENAGLIAAEFNFDPIPPLPEDMDLYPTPDPEDKSTLPLRPPLVTIMGHVDHGKTTLLDYLRKSSVAASEFGGITQHIGAFNVALSSGKTITFLDTPGHAAFLNMRQRGANVTDIVILVVAADDGVKAQTEEAIKHAQSAGVPIIVAINKIDREGADVQRVKQDLARHDLYVEDFGGDIQAIPVSGKTGQGMEDLEEATSLLSEILDHRADPTGPVEGHIIEASTKERGRVSTLLIRRGTLKVGDIIVAGTTFARVRTMRNEAGVEVDSVGPGMPTEIDGWRGQPEAGDEFLEAPDEQRANEAIEYRTVTRERIKMAKDMEVIAESRKQEHERREKQAWREEEIAKATKAGIKNPIQYVNELEKAAESDPEIKQKREEVPLVLKADVSGSEEACHDYIMTVGNNEVCPKIARSGVGPVTEFDVEFASTANGYIVAFNVEIPQHIRRLAGYHGVKFIENNVIYRLVDDIKAVLEERLPPLVTHKVTGEAKILQTFEIGIGGRKKLRIAGCRVENGMVKRTSKVKVLRRNEVIYQGTLSSLKNVKRDVSEMRKDTECGIGFDNWSDFREGDSIQCYEEVFQKRYL